MPRFLSDRDNAFLQQINIELIDNVIETDVVVYKVAALESTVNIYGESLDKAYFPGVSLSCLIERDPTVANSEGFGMDTTQSAKFRFLVTTLELIGLYPQTGDIIQFNTGYYEIDNANEEQLLNGQPKFMHSIICETHLTRRSSLNIDQRQV